MRSIEDRQLDAFIGGLLRAGVLASAVLVLAGAAVVLGQEGGAPFAAHRAMTGVPASLRSVAGVVADALAGSGRAIVQLGVLVLVGTPIARVVLSVFAFAVQRDGVYVCVTLVVLGVLGYSLFGSVAIEHGPRADRATATAIVPGAAPRRMSPSSAVEPARLDAPEPAPGAQERGAR